MDLATPMDLHAQRQDKKKSRNIHQHQHDTDHRPEALMGHATQSSTQRKDTFFISLRVLKRRFFKPMTQSITETNCYSQAKILLCFESVSTAVVIKVPLRSLHSSGGTERVQKTERGWFPWSDISARPGCTGGRAPSGRLLNNAQKPSTSFAQCMMRRVDSFSIEALQVFGLMRRTSGWNQSFIGA